MSNWKIYKNGNYIVKINTKNGTKIRETEENEFIPAFAENCDCKITDKCDGNCPMCYEGCTPEGKHGDILNAKFIDTLHPYTELAINGNDMSHPNLIPFLLKLRDRKVIANITVNQKHFEQHQDLIDFLIKEKLIYGIGISLNHATPEFVEKVKNYPNAVIHVINGVLNKNEVEALKNNDIKMLILGYKQLKRGVDWYEKDYDNIIANQEWLYENLEDMLNHFKVVSFDNLAIEQLDVKRLMTDEEWEEFYMGDDSEFTFYIDLVENKFSKNSIAPQNERYDLLDNVDDMFEKIRKR